MTQIVPAQILDEIYAQQGTDILLVARYHGGEQGAYALADSTGQRFVLKVNVQLDWIEAARVATDTLRAFNYPAPRYLYGGSSPSGTYAVMTTLPGTPRSSISVHLLPRLLELNALQRGRGAADQLDWPQRMIDSVMVGCNGFCELESLRTYSTETDELLVTLQRIVSGHGDKLLPGRDVTHMDFTPANLLQAGGTISGVIDWEGTLTGDAVFDLVSLLYYTYDQPEVRDAIWRAIREQRSPGVVAVYLAHMILRQIDWSIRHHTPAVVARHLRRAKHILCDIGK